MGKNPKKQVTETSKKSHRENKRSGLYDTQNAKVLRILNEATKPITGRRVVEIYRELYSKNIENSSIRRAINSLQRKDKVEVAFTGKCPVTGKTVSYYQIVKGDNQRAGFGNS